MPRNRASQSNIPSAHRHHHSNDSPKFRDLCISIQYCPNWTARNGIREILQNFFDGICSEFEVQLTDVKFIYRQMGGPERPVWVEEWVAVPTGRCSRSKPVETHIANGIREYGRLSFDRKSARLVLIVCFPSTEIPCAQLLYIVYRLLTIPLSEPPEPPRPSQAGDSATRRNQQTRQRQPNRKAR